MSPLFAISEYAIGAFLPTRLHGVIYQKSVILENIHSRENLKSNMKVVRVTSLSAVEGLEMLAPLSGRFIPGKGFRYSLNRTLGGPRDRSGRFEVERKFFFPLVLNPVPFSAQHYHYTEYAIPAANEGKAFPLQGWTGRWGFRRLRLQNF
jgi:hypothetical protein